MMFHDMARLFQTQGMLFFILFLGYMFGKCGLVDRVGRRQMTDLLLYATLPASILHSFQMEMSFQLLLTRYDNNSES